MRSLLIFLLYFCGSGAMACEGYWTGGGSLQQDWPKSDRDTWYDTSQGSRLISKAWYDALPLAGQDARFADPDNQRRYTTQVCNDTGLPVGFVVDDDPVKGAALGLNCSACHTGHITNGTYGFVVEGGASDLDLQGYMADLFTSVDAVFEDGGTTPGPVWTGFATQVLGADHSSDAAADLHTDLRKWLQKRYQIQQSIDDGSGWGHGRSDAVAVILNTASVLSGTRAGARLPVASAPVSYPHVWNAPQMQRVQWNGSATKIKDVGLIDSMEMGAITRNVAEVLGVFADIELTTDLVNDTSTYPSLTSSVRMANLVRIERSMETLKSPAWPNAWGVVDREGAQYRRGKALYDRTCAACHSRIDRNDLRTHIGDARPGMPVSGPVTRMVPAFNMDDPALSVLGTDPMMACNALTHTSWTGKFQALHNSFGSFRRLTGDLDLTALSPDKFPEGAVTLRLIEELALRMIFEKRGELAALQGQDMTTAAKGFFGGLIGGLFGRDPGRPVDPANVQDTPVAGTHALTTIAEVQTRCAELLRAQGPDIRPEYKARPLNGIFATAPFLHNGSVPSLDDLLKPVSQRPEQFLTGAVLYDTARMGLGGARDTGEVSEFRVRDGAGNIIPGNSNLGHAFPARPLSDEDRAALLEYLKTL